MARAGLWAAAAAAVIAGLLAWFLLGRPMAPTAPPASASPPQRIVSLVPSATEILFGLGLGGRVVGVSRQCDYPPEVLELPKAGDWAGPSQEAVLALQPDLVVLQAPEHQEAAERLKALGLQVLSVRQQSVAEILESIRVLGARCGADLAGRRMADELQARVAKVRERPCGPRPRVLVVVHRELGVGSIRGATLAGRGTFYDELLETAGAVNAFSTAGVPWPAVSAEGILKLDPDCIVELVPGLAGRGFTESAVLRDWESLSGLQAVKARRIRLLTGDYVARPGPRFARILEDLRNLPAGSPALQPPADPRR